MYIVHRECPFAQIVRQNYDPQANKGWNNKPTWYAKAHFKGTNNGILEKAKMTRPKSTYFN